MEEIYTLFNDFALRNSVSLTIITFVLGVATGELYYDYSILESVILGTVWGLIYYASAVYGVKSIKTIVCGVLLSFFWTTNCQLKCNFLPR